MESELTTTFDNQETLDQAKQPVVTTGVKKKQSLLSEVLVSGLLKNINDKVSNKLDDDATTELAGILSQKVKEGGILMASTPGSEKGISFEDSPFNDHIRDNANKNRVTLPPNRRLPSRSNSKVDFEIDSCEDAEIEMTEDINSLEEDFENLLKDEDIDVSFEEDSVPPLEEIQSGTNSSPPNNKKHRDSYLDDFEALLKENSSEDQENCDSDTICDIEADFDALIEEENVVVEKPQIKTEENIVEENSKYKIEENILEKMPEDKSEEDIFKYKSENNSEEDIVKYKSENKSAEHIVKDKSEHKSEEVGQNTAVNSVENVLDKSQAEKGFPLEKRMEEDELENSTLKTVDDGNVVNVCIGKEEEENAKLKEFSNKTDENENIEPKEEMNRKETEIAANENIFIASDTEEDIKYASMTNDQNDVDIEKDMMQSNGSTPSSDEKEELNQNGAVEDVVNDNDNEFEDNHESNAALDHNDADKSDTSQPCPEQTRIEEESHNVIDLDQHATGEDEADNYEDKIDDGLTQHENLQLGSNNENTDSMEFISTDDEDIDIQINDSGRKVIVPTMDIPDRESLNLEIEQDTREAELLIQLKHLSARVEAQDTLLAELKEENTVLKIQNQNLLESLNRVTTNKPSLFRKPSKEFQSLEPQDLDESTERKKLFLLEQELEDQKEVNKQLKAYVGDVLINIIVQNPEILEKKSQQ